MFLQIPRVWVRKPDDDVKAFPHLFVDGEFGLNHEPRKKKLTPSKFYAQRIINYDNMYASDPDYVFMAQRIVEMNALERQINMSTSHGSLEVTESDGTKLVPSADAFNIFQSIPGTPAYWKSFRNECCARIEQLGPFHLFFTLSCAEMRWSSVIIEVLKTVSQKKLKIDYKLDKNGDWDGNWTTVFIDDGDEHPEDENGEKIVPDLNQYLQKYLSKSKIGMTDFLKDHFILITRIFDKRAKDFLNVVMKSKGIENYVYRVEFQMRGLPHIHGAGWLKSDLIQHCLDENGLFTEDPDKEGAVIDLIDEWISCSLNTGNPELDEIVRDVNTHKGHTKSCRKHNTKCRFNFPKAPSERTILAKPIDHIFPNMGPKKKEKVLEFAKTVMSAVKNALEEIEPKDFDFNDDLEKFLKEKCHLEEMFRDFFQNVHPNTTSEKTKEESEEEEQADEEDIECPSFNQKNGMMNNYHKLLEISAYGRTVILKRKISERNVNNYNPTFLSIWDANMDIQLCLDSYAVVTYITDYLTKSDKDMTRLLTKALREKKGADVKDILNHLKKTYFDSKETCVSEAAFRLIPGLNMKGSTVKTIFASSGFPENRHMYLHQIEETDSPEPEVLDPSYLKVQGREGKFVKPFSKQDKYDLRPNDYDVELVEVTDGALNNISFAQFTMLYEIKSESQIPKKIEWKKSKENGWIGITEKESKRSQEDIDNIPALLKSFETDEPLPIWIKLKAREGEGEGRYMKLRSVPYVLRIYNGKRKNPIEDMYSELILFLPWRDENKINPWTNDPEENEKSNDGNEKDKKKLYKKDDPNFEESRESAIYDMTYDEKCIEAIERVKQKIYPFSKKLSMIRELLENEDFQRSTHIFDVNPAAEQQNEDDEENLEPEDLSYPFPDAEEQSEKPSRSRNSTQNEIKGEKCIFKQPILPNDRNELYKNARDLLPEQRVVFDQFIHFVKSLVCFKNGGDIDAEPPRMIVHGKINYFYDSIF